MLATVAASGSVPPVNAFDNVIEVRRDPRLLAREQRAGPAEARRDLVENQQQVVAPRGRGDARQRLGRMEPHAAGRLHERLDDRRP